MGNYGIILSLLGCLDQGLKAKKLVDRVIDSCEFQSLVNHSRIQLNAISRRPGDEFARGHFYAPRTIFFDDHYERRRKR